MAMLQQIIDRRSVGQEQVDRQPRALPAPLPGQMREAVRRAVERPRHPRHRTGRRHPPAQARHSASPSSGHGHGRRARDRASGQPGIRSGRPHRAAAGRRRAAAAARARPATAGEGEDDFVFHLTKEEFMQIFFDDLALPRMTRTQLAEDAGVEEPPRRLLELRQRPATCSVVRSMRGAIGAAHRARRRARAASCRALEEQLAACCNAASACQTPPTALSPQELEATDRARCAHGSRAFPILDPIDLRFRNRVKVPVPIGQGRDVLPDGRLGLDGRSAQRHVQALLHPALPVPDAALREDRPGLHPPSHAGAGGRRGEVLPRHAKRAVPWFRARWC